MKDLVAAVLLLDVLACQFVLSNVHMFIVKCDAKKTVSKFATLRI
jgi:hypothetical protein